MFPFFKGTKFEKRMDAAFREVLCRALGGKVGKSQSGWDIGLRNVKIVKDFTPCSFLRHLAEIPPALFNAIECHARCSASTNEEGICIEEIGYNEEGGKEDFVAWEDQTEAYYEKYGWEKIREMDFEKGCSGVETAHKDFADTKNDDVGDKKYVKEGEQKERAKSGSGTTKIIDQGVGSTSGIRACALRYFDLEVMELENTQNNALAKLPMLKLGEYEMWEIRIKQYFQIQDYALWEVIENGNSWVPIPVTAPESGPSTALKMIVPSTAEEKICKKNDVKARSLLLMALPNEHQLTFDQYVDAQSMFVAIKARFGGNEATKKTQKALLKQQYENFNASSSESLDSIFNRLQKLVSRLAILGVVTPPEDLNVKFLRSLPSEWDTHVVVWMNKPDFDTMGLDDLYNNFKIVEQKVKRSTGCINDEKNLAFLITSGASITININTVNPEVSTSTTKVNTASTKTSTAKEMDLKWNMALLSMRARKFYQRTGRKIIIDGSSTAGYDKTKAVRIEDASEKAMCAINGDEFDWSAMAKEEIQANMALMAFDKKWISTKRQKTKPK
ncbi:hypothetical protein Tco_1568253 [Tanacetum coccineum]